MNKYIEKLANGYNFFNFLTDNNEGIVLLPALPPPIIDIVYFNKYSYNQ